MGLKFPDNVVLGATIESDINQAWISRAPPASERLEAMARVEHRRKFISIEPILTFHHRQFYDKILEIEPEFVYIGYCNPLSLARKLRLPEPPLKETKRLVNALRQTIEVRLKTLRPAWYEA